MDTETTAYAALGVMWVVGGGVVLTTLGALCAALMGDGGIWATITPGQALLVALRAILLVAVLRYLGKICITYLHTYRGSKTDGRRRSGYGRRFGNPGRHRATA